jgi:hypothetical protein
VLKAQDSQVTTGDNGGQGTFGGKGGGKKAPTPKPYIGVRHNDPKGQGIPKGASYYVLEGGKEPYCFEATNTDNNTFYRLKGMTWNLVITDSAKNSDLKLSGGPTQPIVIAPTADQWPSAPPAGHNNITPDEIDRGTNSTVKSAQLTIGVASPVSFNQKQGLVKFTIHYCDSKNGCGVLSLAHPECKP